MTILADLWCIVYTYEIQYYLVFKHYRFTYRVSQKNFLREFVEVFQLWALSGHFDIFSNSGHF